MKTVALSQNQKLAACALARGETVTDAAVVAGVSRVTVHAWVRDDSVFLAYLNKLKEENLEAARTSIQSAALTAVKTLVKIMESSKNDSARISAAKEILAMCGLTDKTQSQFGLGIGGTTTRQVESEKSAKMINEA
jgi:hypothetical protein